MMDIVKQKQEISKNNLAALWLSQHWLSVVNTVIGIVVIVPLLAPVFMRIGWIFPAKGIYWVYSFLCHQLPERSYFLFGTKFSYTLKEIQSAWQNTNDVAVLRQFVGNSQMGWKVAWSDRMVSLNTSLWAFGILWSFFRKNVKQLGWWGLLLLIAPMAVDGMTHLVSDFAGIGLGFRDSNVWLSVITKNSLAPNFYSGDAWGSFNAWTRLISGVLFGLGVIWFSFPLFDDYFRNINKAIHDKYRYRQLLLAEKERLFNLRYATQKEQTKNGMTYDGNGGLINP